MQMPTITDEPNSRTSHALVPETPGSGDSRRCSAASVPLSPVTIFTGINWSADSESTRPRGARSSSPRWSDPAPRPRAAPAATPISIRPTSMPDGHLWRSGPRDHIVMLAPRWRKQPSQRPRSATFAQPHVRELRGGDRRQVVARSPRRSGPSATSCASPTTAPSAVIWACHSVAERDDLLVGAADEVPPHHDRLAERRAAEQQQPHRLVVRRRASSDSAPGRRRRPGRSLGPRLPVDRERRRCRRSTPCSKVGSTSRRQLGAGLEQISAPSSGVYVVTGEVSPSSEPRNTRASPALARHRLGAWWAKPGSTCRDAVGQRHPQLGTVQGRWSPAVETSEWLIPRPAVIRLTSPGRTIAWWPALSRCSISPVKSQLTVCSPVCGCGGTPMPPVSATWSGP